jgi:PAS domain S-box-containing protein
MRRAFAQKLLHQSAFLRLCPSMLLLPRSLAQMKGKWTAYVVLFIALSLTLAGYIGHSNYIKNRERARFAQAAPSAVEQTRSRLAVYLAILKGVGALFSTSETISPDEVSRYFARLNIHSDETSRGMDGVGVIWRVPHEERPAHEARIRSKYPGYKVSSKRTNETLYPIVYFEALGPTPNKALGWDVAENEIRRAALFRAERSRDVIISARTQLLYADGTRGAPGFVIYVPIFGPKNEAGDSHVIGFVFGAFDAQKLFSSIFPSPNGMTTLAVFDGSTVRPEALLFDQAGQPDNQIKSKPLLSTTHTEAIFGQPWAFHVATHSAFESSLDRKIPLVLLVVGTLGSFLLFSFVLAQVGARGTAEDLSEELRISEGALRSANAELAAKVGEARRASDALARSLSLQLATLEATGDGILAVDTNGNVVSYNRRYLEMWRVPEALIAREGGFTSRELIDHVSDQIQNPGEFVERIKEISAHPERDYCDFVYFCDGRIFERHSRPQLASSGVIGRVMSFRDVTEQIRATERVAAEKDRLAVTLSAISDAVVATDREGCLLLMNPVAEQMCGVSEESVRGMLIEKIFPLADPATREKLPNQLERLLSESALEVSRPALLINAMGKQLLVRQRAAPTHDSTGQITGAVFVFQDVSQEQKAEQEQLRASKLESIGLLAGGIAHDFNNVLTGIVGNLSLLKEHPDLSAEVTERLGLLERSAYKARQLTMQLLTFAKGGSPIKQTASIVEVIRESTEFALRGSNLKPEFDFASDLAVVEIDTGQMSQVVQNLVINAKHAMPGGGLLRISGKNIKLTGRENLPLLGGDYIRVSIEDFGCGISPEDLGKIFDPYFTTKEKGTGLGLATAYSILKRHEGLITVESEVGKGSIFHLYLPASRAPAAAAKSDTSFQLRGSGSGRILAMDDEPGIRTLLAAILKHFGYDTTTVQDGAEAIREYQAAREQGKPYAAVIMDLTIPGGMGGKETIRALLEIEPNIKAIVCSGYSNDPVLAEYQKYGFIARVEKPYRMQELGKTLKNVLQQ